MNTRLQVEHPVTEMRFGVDLVREQFRVAAGLPVTKPRVPRGHSIEIRVNAEDPDSFFPSLGKIVRLGTPGGPGVRLDSAVYRGLEVTSHYDSMLAKLIVWAEDRETAIERAARALRELRIGGVTTSTSVALRVFESEAFRRGDYDTSILDRIDRTPPESAVDLAALVAAVSKFLGTERVDASPSTSGQPGQTPWVMLDRAERLGRRSS